jgi:hypothetical protein
MDPKTPKTHPKHIQNGDDDPFSLSIVQRASFWSGPFFRFWSFFRDIPVLKWTLGHQNASKMVKMTFFCAGFVNVHLFGRHHFGLSGFPKSDNITHKADNITLKAR